jgi:hypothetical protein
MLSQQASVVCDASQLQPNKLVQSIIRVAVQLRHVNIRQDNIAPNSFMFTTTPVYDAENH